MVKTPKKKRGNYCDGHPFIARRACAMYNCSDSEIGRLFGVHAITVKRWKKKYPQFARSLELGRNEFILNTPGPMVKIIIAEQQRRKRLGLRNTKIVNEYSGFGNDSDE